MHIRDAHADEHDAVVGLVLAHPSALFEWTAAGSAEPAAAARALASWNVDVARVSGGVLVLDDLSGCLLWAGSQKGADRKRLAAQGTRIGRAVYPKVPTECQQRLHDVGRVTRTQRIADLLVRPIRLGGVMAPTPELRGELLRAFIDRVGPLRRDCIAVTTNASPHTDQLPGLGFRPVRDVAAGGTRPQLLVWRRAGNPVL